MLRFLQLRIAFFSLLILVLISSSCVNEIQFELPVGFDKSVVIEGKLAKADISSIEVKISQLFNHDGYTDFFPIDRVLLIDELGESIEIPWIEEQLHYKVLDNIFPVEYGRSYMIRVEFRDGKVVESDYSVLRNLKRNNSLRYEVDIRTELTEYDTEVERKYIQYYYTTELSSDLETKYHHDITKTYRYTDYRRPRIDQEDFSPAPTRSQKRNTCFVTGDRDFSNTKLLDPKLLSKFVDADNKYVNMIYEEPLDWSYAEDANFTVIQESIDDSAYEYYSKITQLLSLSGGMFDPKPAKISSNMKYLNDTEASVYGFFYATAQDTSRLYLSRFELGKPDTVCLKPQYSISSGERLSPQTSCRWFQYTCCDCLVFENSTLEKPHFWKD